jgi:hypothetical protein
LSQIWNRRSEGLENELRGARAEPRPEFVSALAERVGNETRPRRRVGLQLAFAGGLTMVMLVGVAAVGGVSYAATAAVGAARTIEKVLTPSSAGDRVVVRGLTAGGDQYQPGYGWGDDNHNHDGPPAISRRGGKTLEAKVNPKDARFARVSTTISLDEQAQLTISVEGPGGRQLLLSQRQSNVGEGADGPATKNIRYSVLVPRAGIPVDLAIPRNLLQPGVTYFVVIRAKDPNGNVTTLRIPFRA